MGKEKPVHGTRVLQVRALSTRVRVPTKYKSDSSVAIIPMQRPTKMRPLMLTQSEEVIPLSKERCYRYCQSRTSVRHTALVLLALAVLLFCFVFFCLASSLFVFCCWLWSRFRCCSFAASFGVCGVLGRENIYYCQVVWDSRPCFPELSLDSPHSSLLFAAVCA